MAQIKGKQLKDSSIDISKLSGVAADVTANKLLLTAANQSTQALSLSGDLSQTISGSTYSLSIDAGAVSFDKLSSTVKVTNITPASVSDTTFATSNAVKSYVDSQVTASGNGLNIAGDTGTDSVVFTADTLSFVGGANLTTTVTDNEVSTALDSHISIASATLSGNLLVGGNLTVAGQTTTVNSTEVEIVDATFRLGAGTSTAATLATAGAGFLFGEDASGIKFTLDAQADFASTQSIDLADGKEYKIDNVSVLTEDGAAGLQSTAVGNGLLHSAGSVSSKGFTVAHHDINATIASGSIITDSNGNITGPSSVGQIELKINGIAYQEGTSSAGSEKDWYLDGSSNIVWHGDFSLDSTDLLTLSYHPV